MNITIEEATAIVLETQNQYLRGELSEERLADVLSVMPDAAKQWDQLKLNMKVRRRKLMKRAVDVLKVALRKANACKRYRPGKEWSTNAKEKSKICKIGRQFYRGGLHVLETWVEFMAAAEMQAWGA